MITNLQTLNLEIELPKFGQVVYVLHNNTIREGSILGYTVQVDEEETETEDPETNKYRTYISSMGIYLRKIQYTEDSEEILLQSPDIERFVAPTVEGVVELLLKRSKQ